MIKSFLISCCCLLFLGQNLMAGNGFTEISSEAEWQAILKSAQSQNKLILVDLYTTWCGYCKKMDREVFADKAFQEELAVNYLPIKLNAESKFGAGFAQQNGVQGYPTFVFFNGNGAAVGKVEGYEPLKKFRKSTQRIYNSASKGTSYQKAYKKGKLSNKELAEYYTVTKDENIRADIYQSLMTSLSDQDLLNGDYSSFLKATATDLDQRSTKLMLQNKKAFIEAYDEESFTNTIAQLFNNTLLEAIETGNPLILTRMEKELLPYFIDEPTQLPDAILVTKKLYFSGRTDWKSYQELVEEQWQKKPQPEQVYQETYTLLQEFSHEPDALLLASKWLTPQAKAAPSFENYLLLSIIEAVREQMELALQYVSIAKEFARTEEEKGRVAELKTQMEQLKE